MAPTSQGFVALEMLKILEGFDIPTMSANSADALHAMVEAKKLAFADRDRYLADRDFMKIDARDLLAADRTTRLRGLIRMEHAAAEYPTAPSGTDTEYVAAADRDGNLVSFIQSNFMGFGSGVVEPDTGIILQNRGHLFSLDESHPNCIGPHKRCAHTLAPAMIFQEGKPYAALGLKGGHVQPQVQVQLISNLIDHGMTPQQAISAPRFNHIDGLKVGLEPEVSQEIKAELSRRGHQVVGGNPESFGGAHMIVIDRESGAFIGGSDPRKGGCALGF
jgi:gamma-glutamyltranspeptidase/glutathione hydrolase